MRSGDGMRGAWWWVDRWRKSTAYTDLTLAEQGAYRNLLDELWLRDGLLPLDERILAKISGDALAWPSVRASVMAHFKRGKDGYRNETHDEVAAESRRRAEKQKRYRDSRRDGNGPGNGSGNYGGNATGNKGVNVAASPDPFSGSVLRSPDQDRTDPGPAAQEPAVLALVPPSKPRRKAPEDPWPTSQAIDDYRERYGPGSGKAPQIIGGINPLVRGNAQKLQVDAAVAWRSPVRPAWRRYLGLGPGSGTTHPAPSAQDFAAHFADWLPDGRGANNGNGRESVVDLYQGGLELLERERERNRGGESLDADGHARPRLTSG